MSVKESVQTTSVEAEIDVAAYRKYVFGILEASKQNNEPSQRILNRNAAHASVIIEALFHDSTELVEILTGTLNGDVYNNRRVVESAGKFLAENPNARIHILSERDIPDSHPMLVALHDFQDRVTRRLVPQPLQRSYAYHFTVADARSFRYEPSKETFEALVQFRNPRDGEVLHRIFGDLVRQSEMKVPTPGR